MAARVTARGRMRFHGSYTSLILARKKERSIPHAFIIEKNKRYYVVQRRRVENPSKSIKRNGGKKVAFIYGRVLRIEAQKTGEHDCDAECKRCGHKYFHDFNVSPRMLGLSPGDVFRVPAGCWPLLIIK